MLPQYLMGRRWFGAKAQKIAPTVLEDVLPIPKPAPGRAQSAASKSGPPLGFLTLVRVEYVEGDAQTYVLPLGATPAQRSGDLQHSVADTAVARLKTKDGDWLLFDALWNEQFDSALLEAISKRRQLPRASRAGCWRRRPRRSRR